MSYEIVKNISRKKDNRIFITSACNNVWPRTFSEWEYLSEEKYDEERTKNREVCLFHDIIGGNFHLSGSVNEKWRYAENKFYEYCRNNNISTSDLWSLPYQEGNTIEVLRPYYEVFESYLEEKKIGKYYLKSDLGYITRVNEKSFNYTFGIDEKMCKDFKKIYNDFCKLSKSSIDKYNIKIEEYKLVKNNTNKMKIVDKVIPTNIDDAEYPSNNIIYDEEIQIDDMNSVYNEGRARVVITQEPTESYYSIYTYGFEDSTGAGYCYGFFDVTQKEVDDIGGIENLVYETITGEQDKFTTYGIGVATGKSAEELGIQFSNISK